MNLKKACTLILLLICSVTLFVIAAWAEELQNSAESVRCRGRIVSMGDPKYVVKQKCGEPTAKQAMGETWVYDFGPQRFVYYVKFSDGVVFRILTGGYGH